MPQIFRKLEWLDKEDILKRVVSLEFNRLIDYYKEAEEIEQVSEQSPRREDLSAFSSILGKKTNCIPIN